MYGQSAGGNMQQSQRWPTPGPIQRPSNSGSFNNPMNYQNHQNSHFQQRNVRNNVNSSMMAQGVKYFNPQTKRKHI
jgi:hypothetical protein